MWRGGRRHISDALRRVLSSFLFVSHHQRFHPLLILLNHYSFWPSKSPVLAATKQLYKWYFPSVCPSVTPFWLCSHHRIIMKFSGVITNSVRTWQNFQARALGDFHDRVSSAARAWGHKFSSEALHVYMGENRFSLWSYPIGTVFKSIQLSFDIYRVSNHHLVHDIHQMVGGLHNLYTFQWSITSCLSYVEYWPENIKTCLPPCGG